MERLTSFSEYRSLVKRVKASGNRAFSNVYSLPAELDAQINAGRMYYEECAAGVLFYLDEGSYYKVYLCVEENYDMEILPKNKKLMVRNVYKANQKPETWCSLETVLMKNNFCKEGVVLQVRADCENVLEKSKKIEKYQQMLKRNGYDFVSADESMLCEVEELIDDATIIRDYHIQYRTEEEKRKDIEQGMYLCIVDGQKQVCAASIATVKNGIAEGIAIAVKEQYKMNGFAPVLSYERCKRLYEQNVRYINGWILENNEASIKHHKSMGYQFTGYCADEWVLNKMN